MREIWAYIKALFNKTLASLTGGFIALYLVIQPYTSLPSPPRKVFWALVAAAWSVASFRVWREERHARNRLSNDLAAMQRAEMEAEVFREEPRVFLFVKWPGDDPMHGPMRLFVRNQGRFPLGSLKLKPLRIGLHTAIFDEVAALLPGADQPISYHVVGSEEQQEVDVLDLLMINKPIEISPIEVRLGAEVKKQNGQPRDLSFLLTYAPLQNPRRVRNASEVDTMILIEQI
jgi:hypothetical protein